MFFFDSIYYFLKVIAVFVLFSFYFKKKILFKNLIVGFIVFFILFNVLAGIFYSWQTYETWEKDQFLHFLLPPHNSLNYFYQFCFYHFFLTFFVSLSVGVLALVFFLILQKKEFVDIKETLLVFLGNIMIGWPNLILFFLFLFVFSFFLALWKVLFKKDKIKEKVFLETPILFSLFLVSIFGDYFSTYFINLNLLKFVIK